MASTLCSVQKKFRAYLPQLIGDHFRKHWTKRTDVSRIGLWGAVIPLCWLQKSASLHPSILNELLEFLVCAPNPPQSTDLRIQPAEYRINLKSSLKWRQYSMLINRDGSDHPPAPVGECCPHWSAQLGFSMTQDGWRQFHWSIQCVNRHCSKGLLRASANPLSYTLSISATVDEPWK